MNPLNQISCSNIPSEDDTYIDCSILYDKMNVVIAKCLPCDKYGHYET